MADKTKDSSEDVVLTETREAQEIDSKYRMIILAAQRSKQLQRGANPRLDMDLKKHKPTRVAMKELESGSIFFNTTKEKSES